MSEYSELDASNQIVSSIISTWQSSTFKDVALHGNNGPKPILDQLQKVVNFEIEFVKSEQVTIAANPIDRTWGSIEFYVGAREGRGVKSIRELKSFIKKTFKAKSLGRVKTLIPSPGRAENAPGWLFESIYVPFYFDSHPSTVNNTP